MYVCRPHVGQCVGEQCSSRKLVSEVVGVTVGVAKCATSHSQTKNVDRKIHTYICIFRL